MQVTAGLLSSGSEVSARADRNASGNPRVSSLPGCRQLTALHRGTSGADTLITLSTEQGIQEVCI